MSVRPLTMEELLALPGSVDVVTAGLAFGLGRTTAHEMAKTGEFPCRVIEVGGKGGRRKRYFVPRSAIFEALGIKERGTGGRHAMISAAPLPLIDPATLTPAQQDGKRCAVPNCHRLLLLGDSFTAGRLPDGRVVRVCMECAGAVRVERVQDRSEKGAA